MRKTDQPQLAQKYHGLAISRSALQDQGDEDPFAPVEEDEDEDPFAKDDSSDDVSEVPAAGTGSGIDSRKLDEAENGRQRVLKASMRDGRSDDSTRSDADSDDEQGDEFDSDSQSDSHVDMDELTNENGNVTDTSGASSMSSPPGRSKPTTGRRELHQLLKNDTARVAAGISSQDDVKRGRALKEQQATYDRLLDARIKLQKGLTASNDLPSEVITDTDLKQAFERAEAAALSLWSTLDSLRCTKFSSKQASGNTKKRKRPLSPTTTTPLLDIWTHSQSLEAPSLPHRRNTLNHWSARTRASAPSQPHSRFSSNAEPTLTDVLDEYLRKETQKLTATEAASAPQTEDPTPNQPLSSSSVHFSDNAFYQSLLRDLIASRTDNPLITNGNAALASSNNNVSASGKPAPVNSQRNRRNVDTKASKGRKIRYTVHEKLVNFMAPEDRSTWTDGARREFFGSLFGGQGGLDRDADGDVDLEEEGRGVNGHGGREEGALRLFRN